MEKVPPPGVVRASTTTRSSLILSLSKDEDGKGATDRYSPIPSQPKDGEGAGPLPPHPGFRRKDQPAAPRTGSERGWTGPSRWPQACRVGAPLPASSFDRLRMRLDRGVPLALGAPGGAA